MSGLILLVIGLVSLGLVVGAFAYLGYATWRMARRGLRTARTLSPVVAELSRKAAIAQERSAQASLDALAIQRNMEHLQATLTRLQVVTVAFSTAAEPYRRLRTWLGR
jgi:hypothetical protein